MIKKHSLKIWITLLAAMALFMAASAIVSKAAPPADTAPPNYCATSFTSAKTNQMITPRYNDPNMTTEDMMSLYHKTMNDQFNSYIHTMIADESQAAVSNKPDPLGQAPGPVSDTDPTLQACPAGNFSTYCVGMTLLNDETWGYIAYRRALDCRRNKLFDTNQEQDTWNKWITTTTCLGGVQSIVPPATCTPEQEAAMEKEITDRYQGQKALQISARLEAITREKASAKRALDQTLAAYNDLRVAWPMHKKFMEIYKNLTKYRDKMVDIRNQVEQLPSKFIDASTTKCT